MALKRVSSRFQRQLLSLDGLRQMSFSTIFAALSYADYK